MDLNNLSKHQVILVALLVSFVASTATGIITVSLMNQAPPPVTQTIEHVIQTTVEKVAPSANGAAVAQETVIVKEDDATIAAISKSSQSIVRVYGFDFNNNENFAGFGVVATTSSSKNVYIVGNISTANAVRFEARLEGGNRVPISKVSVDQSSGLAIFSAEQSSDLSEARAYVGATFTDSDGVQLGQTVIAIGGQESPFISTGIISSLSSVTVSSTSSAETITNIRANIPDAELLSNAILVDLSGNIVGFKTGAAVSDGFIPAKYGVDLVNQEP